ncbi:IclR family transcriptional regulator [Palleronia aestuarii]|uniref:IclR family transcriptional regulator n=1 Tax=Palleronia aestuarii TaxID=568105 RepID=A0A2W7NZ55_9RHOB|nr:IclR family transcriptional regulator [Palleronia aestuarii]PZX16482.1 IclR family transcriptional regulator [Palleronia aestuarii]
MLLGSQCESQAGFVQQGLLEAFRDAETLSLREIVQRTGLDKSAVQRMTHTLVELGYLHQSAATQRFGLSPRILEPAYEYLRRHPLVERATPILIDLRRQCDERVDLSVLFRNQLTYIQRHQSQTALFYTTLIGRRVPLYCSSGGRSVLASLPEAEACNLLEQEERLPITRFTKTDPLEIWREVETARQQGWAVATSEVIENETVFAAAIRAADGRPVGAVHVSCRTGALPPDELTDKIVLGLLGTVRLLG